MSGIAQDHNKFVSCRDCPHRTVEPNCHSTCEGFLYRQKILAEQKELKLQEVRKYATDKVLRDNAIKRKKRWRK